MSTNGRTEARKILDADGQRAEFPPLKREEFRRIGFWGEVNPDFFKGAVVEKQAAEVLAQGR